MKILQPQNGDEIDAARVSELSVRVRGPLLAADGKVSLELSLDGARPRPVTDGTSSLARLLDPDVTLTAGAHDLVLAAIGPHGTVLDPAGGGVASHRFFVGSRPSASPPPRLVCLAPFGTYYGSRAKIALDFVVVTGNPTGKVPEPRVEASADVEVVIEGRGGVRRARAVGRGPFLLGDFESGDYVVTLTRASGPPTLPGSCVFALNRELERSP